MGTSLEGTTEDILAVVGELHAVPFELGVPRVYTVLKLDERRDKDQTLDDKVASVERCSARPANHEPGRLQPPRPAVALIAQGNPHLRTVRVPRGRPSTNVLERPELDVDVDVEALIAGVNGDRLGPHAGPREQRVA